VTSGNINRENEVYLLTLADQAARELSRYRANKQVIVDMLVIMTHQGFFV